MEIITVDQNNLEKEHICCAISSNNDIQVKAKKAWLDKMPTSDQTFMMNVLTTHFGSKKKKTGLKRMIKKTKPSGSKKSIIAAKNY